MSAYAEEEEGNPKIGWLPSLRELLLNEIEREKFSFVDQQPTMNEFSLSVCAHRILIEMPRFKTFLSFHCATLFTFPMTTKLNIPKTKHMESKIQFEHKLSITFYGLYQFPCCPIILRADHYLLSSSAQFWWLNIFCRSIFQTNWPLPVFST